MNPTKKKVPIPKGRVSLPVPRPQPKPNAILPKMANAAVNRKTPTPPPVYRPQPVPKVLQPKKLSGVAQLMEIRQKFYGKIGVGVPPERLIPLIPLQEPNKSLKDHINGKVEQLHNRGKATGRPAPLNQQDIETATEKLIKSFGGGYSDYGDRCRKAAPKLIALAVAKGYDIRDDKVLNLLYAIIIPLEGIDHSTVVGNFQGKWSGGGFFEYPK